MTNKILIVVAHPNLHSSHSEEQPSSKVNVAIMDHYKKHLPNADILSIYDDYPDGHFDVEKEQQRILQADTLILQYPMYWYSFPSLMKKWVEDVFVHKFAMSSQGSLVKGKRVILSFTSAIPLDGFDFNGYAEYPIDYFLAPLKRWISQCSMTFGGYVHTGGYSYFADEEQIAAFREKAVKHAEEVIGLATAPAA